MTFLHFSWCTCGPLRFRGEMLGPLCHFGNTNGFCFSVVRWHQGAWCTSVHQSLIFLQFCCARPSNPHSPINPVAHFLHSAGGRTPLISDRVPVVNLGVWVLQVGYTSIAVTSLKYGSKGHLHHLGSSPQETGTALFLKMPAFVTILPCNCCMRTCKTEVGFPSYFLTSSLWLYRKNHRVPRGVHCLSGAGLTRERFLLMAEALGRYR